MADESTLSARELAMRRHMWLRFMEIAHQAVHRLPLSTWEEEFIENLASAGAQSKAALALSDKQLKVLMKLEDRLRIKQLLDEMRGDPRLTAWEEGFLLSLTRQQGDLSDKQLRVLERLQAKVQAPPAEADNQDA
jgi:hypothetical protein